MEQQNEKYAYFVLLNPKKTKFSFSAYSDHDGQVKFVWNRMDYKTKEPMKRRFQFSKAYRTIRVPLAQTMKNPEGEVVKVVTFLREHPECAGSPNAPVNRDGVVVGKPLFKEMNESKDAEIAVEARRRKIIAENAALELTGAKLESVSMLAGYIPRGEFNEALAIHKCLEAAAHDPIGFIKVLEDDTHEMRSFLTKAIRGGVVSQVGDNYLWGKILIGSSEEEAVGELIADAQLVRGIQMKLNKIGIGATAASVDKILDTKSKNLKEARLRKSKLAAQKKAKVTE